MSRDPSIPLARLFAMALNAFTEPLHQRLAECGFGDVRPAYAFVLLALRERPLTGSDVAAFMGMTKQAASKLVDALEAAEYVTRRAHPEDARAKLLHVAPRGKRVLEAAEAIYAELEASWAEVLGERRVSELRKDLTRVLARGPGGALPPIKPTW